MEIKYELTTQDYIDFNLECMSSSATVKKSLFIQRYIVPIAFLVVPFVTDMQFWYWAITFVLWIVFYPKYFKRSISKRTSKLIAEDKNEELLGARILSLNENEIVSRSKLSESKTSWGAVQKIAETEKHIFIYVSTISAYIIPTKAFETANQKNEFINTVNANMCEKK